MGKKLSEMTLEELWTLFPIFLTAHQSCWKTWFEEERAFLETILPQAERISHIGSTAIESIWAKPIIDILAEFPHDCSLQQIRDICCRNGYICMHQAPNRISLNKGYTENGFADRVFHLHVRYCGDNDELFFRDYLNSHPECAREYEELKLQLWKRFPNDRDGYTDAKTELVQKLTAIAKKESLNA